MVMQNSSGSKKSLCAKALIKADTQKGQKEAFLNASCTEYIDLLGLPDLRNIFFHAVLCYNKGGFAH